MDDPTLDELRDAKAAIVRQFKGIGEFAGAGIGRDKDGRLVIQVNWRAQPAGVVQPARIGNVAVIHQVVGVMKPFGD